MRGKKPKERKCYILRMDNGTLVAVDRDVYLEWHRARRREKYQRECGSKNGVCSLDALEEKGCVFGTSVSITDGLEEIALRELCMEKLRDALGKLEIHDAYLIQLLYFEDSTVKAAAQAFGCSRKSIQNRRKRILGELRMILKESGMHGGFF